MTAGILAQQVIDKAYLTCQYKYSYLNDTLAGKSQEDILILQIGKKISKCFSYYTAQIDSLDEMPNGREILHKQIKQAFATNVDPPHKRMRTYIYKNYPEAKKMFVTDGVSLQDYCYEDSLNLQNWEIKDSTKNVMGYETQLAECDFRGRHWTVWFAEEIPINNGPWKLGNLPGLILEAYDQGMQHHFVMNGMEKTPGVPIVFSKTYIGSKKFERTTRKKFLRLKMKSLCDMNGYIFMETGIDLGVNDKQKELKYDLLERDYK